MSPVEWVLFDWGNVLVEYRPLGFLKLADRIGVDVEILVGEMDAQALIRQLCTGEAGPEQLCAWLAARFDIPITEGDIVDLFADDVRCRLPGVEPLVAELAQHHRLAILSNTFFGHWHQVLTDPFYRAFEHRMPSHELGAVKPDPAIYARALGRLGCHAERIVFIDDKVDNTTAAQAAGMRVIHARSVQDAREGLVSLGCLGRGRARP